MSILFFVLFADFYFTIILYQMSSSRNKRRKVAIAVSNFLNITNEYQDDNVHLEKSKNLNDHSDCSDFEPVSDTSLHEECNGDESPLHSSCNEVSTSSDSGGENPSEFELQIKLRDYAIENNIPYATMDKLLCILKPYHTQLPKCSKTLLNSKPVTIRIVTNGEFLYIGVEPFLQTLSVSNPSIICLQFNIDGVPIYHNSEISFWPILVKKVNDSLSPKVVAIFSGRKKPNLQEFFSHFITEINHLKSNGVTINSHLCNIHITNIVCDAPARAFIKCIKYHSGYSSCDKCTVEGEWLNKVVFLETDAPLRTLESFVSREDDSHHIGVTPLLGIPIHPINSFPNDYMHSVCLGVVRKLLNFWSSGPFSVKLSSQSLKTISARLIHVSLFFPSDFNRRPRSLESMNKWKATEFRSFLLYSGPIVLCDILSKPVYEHFLILHSSIFLLCRSQEHEVIKYCGELLKIFVTKAVALYGKSFMSYNVHSLIHLDNDCLQFGPLGNFCAFPFENALGHLKRRIRSGYLPLQQVASSLSDNKSEHSRKVHTDGVSLQHCSGPLPNQGHFLQYKVCHYKNQRFSSGLRDSSVMVGQKCYQIVNILAEDLKNPLFLARCFTVQTNFYDVPLASSKLSIFKVSCLSDTLHTIPFSDIVIKCCCLPYSSSFVVIPLSEI
nr:uncharacterized protein LOC124809315 [Hydra vulgaris]